MSVLDSLRSTIEAEPVMDAPGPEAVGILLRTALELHAANAQEALGSLLQQQTVLLAGNSQPAIDFQVELFDEGLLDQAETAKHILHMCVDGRQLMQKILESPFIPGEVAMDAAVQSYIESLYAATGMPLDEFLAQSGPVQRAASTMIAAIVRLVREKTQNRPAVLAALQSDYPAMSPEERRTRYGETLQAWVNQEIDEMQAFEDEFLEDETEG